MYGFVGFRVAGLIGFVYRVDRVNRVSRVYRFSGFMRGREGREGTGGEAGKGAASETTNRSDREFRVFWVKKLEGSLAQHGPRPYPPNPETSLKHVANTLNPKPKTLLALRAQPATARVTGRSMYSCGWGLGSEVWSTRLGRYLYGV